MKWFGQRSLQVREIFNSLAPEADKSYIAMIQPYTCDTKKDISAHLC